VGTASILASIRQTPKVVTAGLLHAAYVFGDFGDGTSGITEARRARVRRAVGTDVEELIARYTRFDWNKDTIPGIRARVDTLTAMLPETLRNTHDYTFVQPPESHSPRFKIAVGRFLDARPRLARAVQPVVSFVGIRG